MGHWPAELLIFLTVSIQLTWEWENTRPEGELLGWPKRSFGFFHTILQEKPEEIFAEQ